jgi:hypothetical protein
VVLFLATLSAIRQRAKARAEANERAKKIEQRNARIEAMLTGQHSQAA